MESLLSELFQTMFDLSYTPDTMQQCLETAAKLCETQSQWTSNSCISPATCKEVTIKALSERILKALESNNLFESERVLTVVEKFVDLLTRPGEVSWQGRFIIPSVGQKFDLVLSVSDRRGGGGFVDHSSSPHRDQSDPQISVLAQAVAVAESFILLGLRLVQLRIVVRPGSEFSTGEQASRCRNRLQEPLCLALAKALTLDPGGAVDTQDAMLNQHELLDSLVDLLSLPFHTGVRMVPVLDCESFNFRV